MPSRKPNRSESSSSAIDQPPGSGRASRRKRGEFYTPPEVVEYLVHHTLTPLAGPSKTFAHSPAIRPLRILDPACGDGMFLAGVLSWLRDRHRDDPLTTPTELFRRHVTGWDVSAKALTDAHRRIRAQLGAPVPSQKLIRADALLDADTGAPGSFDAIVANPPYVGIRILSRLYGDVTKRSLASRYQCAQGSYDLYVLFIERAVELLRDGGMCGMIIPNKIATRDYAAECRRLLSHNATIECIVDLSAARVFPDADVYPYIMVWRKSPPPPDHSVQVRELHGLEELNSDGGLSRTIPQTQLRQADYWSLHDCLDIESRVPTQPLRQCAHLQSGTTGFVAQQIADSLVEADPAAENDAFDFVVSGNIDRYAIRPGNVRFMKRLYKRPRLPAAAPPLTANKRSLFEAEKIVVAGMTRRLEAAWSPRPLALGVQVYAVIPEPQQSALFLLAVLNSRFMSFLFRRRYHARRMAGGFLAINKRQLASLPIPTVDATEQASLAKLAEQILKPDQPAHRFNQLDQQIDQAVYRLFQLTSAEQDQVESCDFAS